MERRPEHKTSMATNSTEGDWKIGTYKTKKKK
jgi:hypothetical protein